MSKPEKRNIVEITKMVNGWIVAPPPGDSAYLRGGSFTYVFESMDRMFEHLSMVLAIDQRDEK